MIPTFNLEIEKHVIAGLLQFPETFGDLQHITPDDFSKAHAPIFTIIQQQLSLNPQGSVAPISLAEKIKAYNISLQGIDAYDYLEALRLIPINSKEIESLAKELKILSVRRQLMKKCDEIKSELSSGKIKDFSEMTGLVEKGLTEIATSYYKEETEEIFADLESIVEERGNNPIDASKMGYQGPFESVNKTLGALIFPGSFTVVGARTGNGKSSLSFFWCNYVAEKYDIPLLWLDAAEMTVEQLRFRAVCCFSEGRVPLWAVRSGEWRSKKEWVDIIRGEIWPKVKKMKMYFCNTGAMDPKAKIAFIRRFYYNKVGRGNFMLIGDDYLKGIESMSKNTDEYKSIGYYVGDIKTLVTDEILAGYWTSVQNNRTGIYTGKKASEIQDSEGSMSLSDRIIQQATVGLTMRYKVPEELAFERNLFGNVVLKTLKVREGYGKEYEKIARPIKLPNGQFATNYFNLDSKNFYYSDKGLYSEILDALGQNTLNMTNPGDASGAKGAL